VASFDFIKPPFAVPPSLASKLAVALFGPVQRDGCDISGNFEKKCLMHRRNLP